MSGPSKAVRIAHNLGLATWFGGSLFGQVALNPAVSSIRDRSERGRVVSEAWSRYSRINSIALVITVLTWRAGGLRTDAELRSPVLARAKNLLLGGALICGFLSGVLGITIARQAPEGAPEGGTPIEEGARPAPETPERAALAQRLIGLTGSSALALVAGVVAVSAVIESSPVRPRGLLSRLFL
jgi:hypothetical protein